MSALDEPIGEPHCRCTSRPCCDQDQQLKRRSSQPKGRLWCNRQHVENESTRQNTVDSGKEHLAAILLFASLVIHLLQPGADQWFAGEPLAAADHRQGRLATYSGSVGWLPDLWFLVGAVELTRIPSGSIRYGSLTSGGCSACRCWVMAVTYRSRWGYSPFIISPSRDSSCSGLGIRSRFCLWRLDQMMTKQRRREVCRPGPSRWARILHLIST